MRWNEYKHYYESETGYRVPDHYKNKPVIKPYRVAIGIIKNKKIFIAYSPEGEMLERQRVARRKDKTEEEIEAVKRCQEACELHYENITPNTSEKMV